MNSYNYTLNNVTYSGVDTFTCHGRQWTMGTAMSPAGLQWNFLPRHRLQPFLESHGGYMFSAKSIPVEGAGAFNFTVDAGGGLEYFRTHGQSIRAQWRYHHTSNHDTGLREPRHRQRRLSGLLHLRPLTTPTEPSRNR